MTANNQPRLGKRISFFSRLMATAVGKKSIKKRGEQPMSNVTEVERLVYNWCTSESRGTDSARALATIYASTYLDGARLLRFADLRALDDIRLKWALTLIQGYVEGTVRVPWPRAVALVALYDLIPDELDA